jgi:hypothetical protein
MATGFEFFERDLKLATADLEPAAINGALAAFARQELAKVIASGQASSVYEKYVNEVRGAAEETVKVPGGILYEFSSWGIVIDATIEELKKRSPSKSGRFRNSFIVLANQKLVTDWDAIPANAEVIITNFQPYVRKAETGALKVKRYYIFDGSKNAMARRFGQRGSNAGVFRFETKWLNFAAGVYAGMPYILKGSQGRRKDRQAGMPITYPSILINRE